MDLLVQLTTWDIGRTREKIVKVAREEHVRNLRMSVWEASL